MAEPAPVPGLAAGPPKIVRVTPPEAPAAEKRPALDILLKIEAEARRAATPGELAFLAANETMRLTGARQICVLRTSAGTQRVVAVSSVGQVDRNAPRIRWIESVVAALGTDAGLGAAREFTLPAYGASDEEEAGSYPFRYMLWLPFGLRGGETFAGMLLARDTPWSESERLVAARLSETYAHAWAALVGPQRLKRRVRLKPWMAAGLVAAAAAGFYPVPLTVLAPVAVTSVAPWVVAAPLAGVVASIEVDPNQTVAEGTVLLRMADTVLRNELAVAERDVDVAEAGLKRISQAAVGDPKMRSELALARTERLLAVAKRDYARELFARSTVTAPAAGVAIFTDRRDWIGRPVSTGERIMEIADPDRLELRIDVPVADAVALKSGARVRAFLDSDPLRPVPGSVRAVSFEARKVEDNSLAYRIYAAAEGASPAMRLGVHGTAQVSGDAVPLAYSLFRRPIAAARQWLGL